MIFFVGEEYIWLRNVKNKKITIADSSGEVTSQVYDVGFPVGMTATDKSKTNVAVNSDFEGTLDLSRFFRDVKNIDASESDCSLAVIGNDKANVFKAGTGGGNSGTDVLIYSKGDGNDVIYNYESGQDSIQLSSDVTVSKVAVRGKDVTLYFTGGGSVKVRDATGKAITLNENGNVGTYTFTKSTKNGLVDDETVEAAASAYMERFWFDEDNGFNVESLDSLLQLSTGKTKDNPKYELSTDNLYNVTSLTDMVNGCSASIGSFSDS